MKKQIENFWQLQQKLNNKFVIISVYDIVCVQFLLSFRNFIIQFSKSQNLNENAVMINVNDEEKSKKLKQKSDDASRFFVLKLFLWQIINVTWLMNMKDNLIQDDIVMNNMSLNKTIIALSLIVRTAKLRAEQDSY